MKPTLLILAAGMGSRYGGLKQIDGIGPNQEPIIEYSIYDAVKSGLGNAIMPRHLIVDNSVKIVNKKNILSSPVYLIFNDIGFQTPLHREIIQRLKNGFAEKLK